MTAEPGELGHRSWFARVAEARVPGLVGEQANAATTVQWFLLFSLVLTAGYTIFDVVYDASALAPLIVVNIACGIGYALGIVVVRFGHQLGGAVVALSIATVQIVWATTIVGWESGYHLFLLGGAQLVFLIFTARQRALRGVWLAVALATFMYCQLGLPASEASAGFPRSVLTALFSINAVATAFVMYVLAAVSYARATTAQRDATANAERAEFLANTDALTGLPNRRPVMEHLAELAAAQEPYAVALADLDHFKMLNDEHGHSCGDHVLAALGDRLRSALRTSDTVGRWGGEEFIFVLPGASLADATTLMERVRSLTSHHVVVCGDHDHRVTVSIGVADATATSVLHRVIKRADDALYDAKAGGRDQVRTLRATSADARPATTETRVDGISATEPGGPTA